MSSRSLPRFTRDLRVLRGGRDERTADMTTMNDERWTELQQAEDMAYFKADRATRSRLMQYHYDTKGVM